MRPDMTVCIGVLCDNRKSVILVADRMITSGLDIQFEHPVTNKVTSLSTNCLALTSGNAFAHTELFDDVSGQTVNTVSTSVESFVELIKQTYHKLRQKQIVERHLMPRGFASFDQFYRAQAAGLSDSVAVTVFGDIERFNYGLSILIGGLSPAAAHLYVVTDPGTSVCLDSLGFHVIGSGLNLALSSLIANHCHPELPYSDALLVALDAKMTAENAPGVGKKTDATLLLSTSQGVITVSFDDNEIERLRALCKVRRDGDDTSYGAEIVQMVQRRQKASESATSSAPARIIRRGANNAPRKRPRSGKAEVRAKDTGTVPTPDQVPNKGRGRKSRTA
jgi:20S proteasome alpha/beta subunit